MNTTRAEAASGRIFVAVAALLFLGSVAATIRWSLAMSGMGGMPMPGGWLLSMVWLRACGRSWAGSAADFLVMWVMMMAAMMLPSLVPALWWCRRAAEFYLAGLGYFLVWTGFGLAVFALGAVLAAAELRLPALARATPLAAGLVVLAAGALQFSAWKAHRLACCRAAGRPVGRGAAAALRAGLRLGLQCGACSAGSTSVLLALGVMDLRVMAAVTVATTIERLAPDGRRAAQAVGAVAIVVGLLLIGRAAGLG
jgi:predicted metal-binding membrane protein